METKAECDLAVDCPDVSISPNRPSKAQCHDDTSKIPCFDTFTVESAARLVRSDIIRVGYGARLPRIAHSQNIGPQTGEYAPRPSNIGEVACPP